MKRKCFIYIQQPSNNPFYLLGLIFFSSTHLPLPKIDMTPKKLRPCEKNTCNLQSNLFVILS